MHFKAVSSVRNYISGIRTLLVLAKCPVAPLDSVQLQLVVRGLDRLNSRVPRRALPITPQILAAVHARLDHTNPTHVTLWALFLFAFFTFARKSNLVPNKWPAPPRSHYITRGDIHFVHGALVATFRSSKTNQFADRVHVVPLLPWAGSILCPVKAFQRMLELVPAPPTLPAFVYRTSSGNLRPITYPVLTSFLKGLIAKLGLDPKGYSSHSFRRGGATWAFKSKVPAELIKATGDWKSSAYLLYLDLSFQDKLRVSSAMLANIQAVEQRQPLP